MRWRDQRESENVIDERGRRIGGGHLSLGGLLLILLVSYVTGTNPLQLLAIVTSQSGPANYSQGPYRASAKEEETKHFLGVVLASTEDVWKEQFAKMGRSYEDPSLVVFADSVDSACGLSSSATGPFYCPGDRRLYIDIGFLGQLQTQLGAEGDFAAAYVLAHEVGHHVQTLLGIERRVRQLQEEAGAPKLIQVKMELQADCLSGVWAYYAKQAGLLEIGDIEEGINAAKAVGDDRIQSMSGRGYVNPESFTHGSSAERAKWFEAGLASGSIANCNTL